MELTEVTSIAQEEERTGQKIILPSEEIMVQRAIADIYEQRRYISGLLKNMSHRGIYRAVMAILDLPAEKIPVKLLDDDEKMLYARGQRLLTSRYLVLHHATRKAFEEHKLKQQEKELENEKQQDVQETK
jgi:hypothetical protein